FRDRAPGVRRDVELVEGQTLSVHPCHVRCESPPADALEPAGVDLALSQPGKRPRECLFVWPPLTGPDLDVVLLEPADKDKALGLAAYEIAWMGFVLPRDGG